MRHLKKGRKLGRRIGPRRALLKNLARSLILFEKIKTTEAKAKELKPFVERLVTISKRQNLASRRLILKRVNDPRVAAKLIEDLSNKYKERPGGYTRIIKIGMRKGDKAKMAVIELV